MLRRLLILALLCLGTVSFPPRPARAQTPDPAMADVITTLRARKVLEADAVLAPLQLGVRVRGGVATLWGPVPSLDLSSRAVKKLRALAYITDVRNNLVVTPDDFLPPAAPRMLTPAAAPVIPTPVQEPKTPRPNQVVPVEASLPTIVVPVPQQSLRVPLRDE